jgi:putative transposase
VTKINGRTLPLLYNNSAAGTRSDFLSGVKYNLVAQINHSRFDPQNHTRKSIRIKEYDYTQPGAYFVTIVTFQRDCLFGEIKDEIMILNAIGKIADECWRVIPEHFPNVELGAHIIMPNHVHGIVVITDNGRGTPRRAPTPQFGNSIPGSNATIIGQYKSSRIANY